MYLPARFCFLVVLLPIWCAAGEPRPAPLLGGPEVAKVDWNTRALVASDLDGDGKTDLAVINNDRAAIDLLYQREAGAPVEEVLPRRRERWSPVLEDARFRRDTLIVGQALFDLVAGDFDGDGRMDFAATGEPAPVVLRLARENGRWEERVLSTAPEPVRFIGGLVAADVDGDGRTDLVQLGQKELAVFLQREGGGGLVLDEKLTLSDDDAYGLGLEDVDGDGRLDLLHLVSGHREALRVRRQLAAGKFGPEQTFALRTPRSPLVRVREGADAGREREPLFASALGGSGQVEFTRLGVAAPDDVWRGMAPSVFAPLAGVRSTALYASGDWNGDGGSDLAVAFAESAQVWLYVRQADGAFGLPRRVSSVTDARALGAVTWGEGERPEILVLSGKENVLAALALGDEGVVAPPRTLPIPGRLITFATGRLGTGGAGLAVVSEEGGERRLTLWERGGSGELRRGASVALAGLRADPRSVFWHDLNQDGRADFLLAVPALGVRVYLTGEDGALVDAASGPLFRPGLLGRPEAAAGVLSAEDVDGDGREELLIAAENFLRALRLGSEGSLETVAQFEAESTGAEITTGFVLGERPGQEGPRVILHDRRAQELHLLRPGSGGLAAETLASREVPRLEVTGTLRLAGPGGRRELFWLGKDRFWWMPEGGAGRVAVSEGAYVSEVPELRHQYVTAGDLDGDGVSELVAVDLTANSVEVLGRESEGAWRSLLHFRVFERDPHHAGGRSGAEPREARVVDVTGDGRPDLVLLVHDRILVYPQE